MTRPIYLDHNATTPVDPRVLEAMLPFFKEECGNASSKTHAFGWHAGEAVERARAQIGSPLNVSSREVVFTSGATESNNLVINGLLAGPSADPHGKVTGHVITQATEHPAVHDPLKVLEKRGCELTYLKTDRYGRVSPEDVESALRESTRLVTIMAANNEIGTLQPLAEIGAVCQAAGVLFHTDAAQAVGKIPLDLKEIGVDLLSLSGHKLYGPKGVGALIIRRRTPPIRLAPMTFGGGQEKGLRPGTLNVPGIVGLGEACRVAQEEMPLEMSRLRELRDRLRVALEAALEGLYFNGHPDESLSGTLSASFEGVEGPALLVSLTGELAVSSGSACSSGAADASHVLSALGVSEKLALATIRFGLGRSTTVAQVDAAAATVINAVCQQRQQFAALGKGARR